MSEGTATAASTDGNTASSNHMATLVPTFDPSKDDLEQYTQKVELLSEIWPATKINELITRLILNTSGTAFQKLQLNNPRWMMTNDKKGVQLLVQLLGGQWGKVNLEKKYDIVERALFRCLQKQDESNDSFLARCDVVWSELLAKKVQLEEIQSYILRGSRLSTEKKKRVIVESESSSSGVLNMEKVTQSVRMLGTSFFNEMIGQKVSKGKIYESQVMLTEDQDDFQHDESADVADEYTEDEFVGQLLQDDDEDAALIADYESRAADVLQGDSDLAATYNAYADARRRLSDRFKHRGFWPVGQGKGSGKSSASKGKGKYFNKVSKKSLQQRILESHCRLCGRKGHWRAECPDQTRSNASTGSTNTSAAMTVSAVSQSMEEPNALPMEFMQLPMVHEETLDVPSWQEIDSVSWVNGVKGKIIKTRMKACPGMNESQSNLRAVLWHPWESSQQ